MALMTSLIALSVDMMLPALTLMGEELGSATANDNQLIIALLFLGLAIGQLIYGPLSDSVGRKIAAYLGYSIFFVGCLVCLLAENFTAMLIGRFLQGLGLGGPRIMSIAIVRDQYVGREMAKVISFVMAVFILVPMLAPALGQAILLFSHWNMIFVVLFGLGLISFAWFLIRQPETLLPANRQPFSLTNIRHNIVVVCKNKYVMAYTISAGIVFGSFMAYLNSVQQILQGLYSLGTDFAMYFAFIAAGIGLASVVNGALVMRFGMHKISYFALTWLGVASIIFLTIAWQYDGVPPLWQLMSYFMLALFCVGLLFGNLNALAMEPLGKMAGIGASVIGFVSSMLSVPIGVFIGSSFNGTIIPMLIGFVVCSITALIIMLSVRNAPAINASNE
jgi:DHA1 family bicyclomycin/chloramphenicol resistance-like MFS transporter